MKWEQRELEFRAYFPEGYWCIRGEKSEDIVGGYYCQENYGGTSIMETIGLEPYDEEDGVFVVQYTGVKDINGKKIFEGDIVNMLPLKKWASWIGYVEYEVNSTAFIVHLEHDLSICSNSEILGNVFQYPELVEKYGLEF